MKIVFATIGVVRNAIKDRHMMPPTGIQATIHINKKYQKALYRITQEKYLWILCYMHKAKKDVLMAKPKKSKVKLKITRGVFSIHSPDRPNPIALTKVKLLRRKGLVLYVDNLDMVDGTPVIDIKGYR